MDCRTRSTSVDDIIEVGTGLAIVVASVLLLALVTVLYHAVLLPFKLLAPLLRRPRLASALAIPGAAVLLSLVTLWLLNRPTNTAGEEVVIARGATVRQIGRTLRECGLIRSPVMFNLAAKAYGLERKVRAGKYALDGRMSTVALLKKLAWGSPMAQRVTIPEGLARPEIAQLLQEAAQIDSAAFIRATEDSLLRRRVAALAGLSDLPSNLEGYLFPDTYDLHWQSDPRALAERLVARFAEVFVDSLHTQAHAQGLSTHQIVILASIIEGEARLPEERSWISAVFRRRLERGMPLQADPTVQYALKAYRKRLSDKDLQVDSPYNTYLYPGLPPGPICSPGKASLLAALYPADVPYLYFVARGDGSHIFSRTLRQHEAARRKVKREAQKR